MCEYVAANCEKIAVMLRQDGKILRRLALKIAERPPGGLFRLKPRDADRYADHLLRLDDEDRRFRFFDDAPEFLIAMHAGAAASDGRIAFGWEEDGEIRAAGELVADAVRPEVGELAFSVEKDWRRRGLGAALMDALIDAGARAGFSTLELEFLPQNSAMRALARGFSDCVAERGGRLAATVALKPGVNPG
jgi:GNAT superfamily N-acetyltransferase